MSNAMIMQVDKLDDIGAALVGSAETATKAGTEVILGIVNNTVVPWALVALFLLMLFFIVMIAVERRKHDGDGTMKNVVALGICFVIFLIIGSYGVVFGGLISVITGGV